MFSFLGKANLYAALGSDQEFSTTQTEFTVTGNETSIREIIDRTFSDGNFGGVAGSTTLMVVDVVFEDGSKFTNVLSTSYWVDFKPMLIFESSDPSVLPVDENG